MILRVLTVLLSSALAIPSLTAQSYTVYSAGGRQGLLDPEGKQIVPARFDRVGWTDGTEELWGELIGYQLNGSWGLVNTHNRILSDPIYYKIGPLDARYIKVAVKGPFSNQLFHGLTDRSGKVVLSCSFFDIEPYGGGYIVSDYQRGNILKGWYDAHLKPVIPARFAELQQAPQGFFAAKGYDGKWQFYLADGYTDGHTYDGFEVREGAIVVRRKGRYGLLRVADLTLSEPVIFKAIPEEGGPLRFPEWEVYGLDLDSLHLFRADSISIVGDLFISHVNGNQEVLVEGRELIAEEEVVLKYASEGFLITRGKYDGKWRLMTTEGRVIIDQQDSLYFDGLHFAALDQGSWQVFNRFGRKLSPRSFEAIAPSVSHYVPVKRLGYWTLMDFQGQLLTAPKFDSIVGGTDNRIIVEYIGGHGMLNAFGEWVLRPVYDEISITGPVVIARTDRRHRVFNLQGEEQFVMACDEMRTGTGFIAFRQGSCWGLLNSDGDYIADAIYEEVGQLGDLYYGKTGQYVSLFLEGGRQVADANDRIRDITGVHDDLYRVVIDDRVGYVDALARLRIANRYEDGGLFYEDRLPVKLLGRWGYVDKDEQLVIQPSFEFAGNFDQGIAIVRKAGYYGLIDKEGGEILERAFRNIRHQPGSGYILETDEGKWGATDGQGRVILTPNYEMIREASNGLLLVNRDGRWGVIDQTGYTRVPFEYEDISQKGAFFLMKKSAHQ